MGWVFISISGVHNNKIQNTKKDNLGSNLCQSLSKHQTASQMFNCRRKKSTVKFAIKDTVSRSDCKSFICVPVCAFTVFNF